ncbi:hypothetical protein LCGC14_2290010, partial [marine sediment metagenome]
QPGSSEGLGLIEMETSLAADKTLRQNKGKLLLNDADISGYEIHAGVSYGKALEQPLMQLDQGSEGVISADNKIIGTYLHGLFEQSAAFEAILHWAGLQTIETMDYKQLQETDINKLADMIDDHIDTEKLMRLFED